MKFLNNLVASALPYIPKSVVRRVSRRYIAGVTFVDAIRVVKGLNQEGFIATLDLLGEDVSDKRETLETRSRLMEMFREIHKQALNSNVSVKLTQLGLRIDKQLCYENVRTIAEEARKLGNFVRIDMEDSTTTTETIGIYEKLMDSGHENVGIVIQAYLRRSEADVRALIKRKANFRLCKGIYIESPEVAFQDRDEIRRNFALLLRTMLENGCYVGIATHDDYLVEKAYDIIGRNGLKPNHYEFQMLLGVQEKLRNRILRDGHRLRVYVPYGEHWYAYSVRRLKENPQIVGYVMRAMIGGG